MSKKTFFQCFFVMGMKFILSIAFILNDPVEKFSADIPDFKTFFVELENGNPVLKDVSEFVDFSKLKSLPTSDPKATVKEDFLLKKFAMETDYIHLNMSSFESKFKNLEMTDIPEVVTVEVASVIGSDNFVKRLGSDISKTAQYAHELWRQIDKTYSDSKSPRIRVKLTALIIHQSLDTEKYIKDNYVSETQIVSCLGDFRNWFLTIQNKPKYDIAMLAMSYQVGEIVDGNYVPSNVVGIAYGGTACSKISNCAYSRTIPPAIRHTDIVVNAHELAHLLNVKHDSNTECSGSNNIMGWMGERTFSRCSLEQMNQFARSNRALCLRD